MTGVYAGLGFGAACEVKPGDYVRVGGRPREVIAVRHVGRDWPYYQLRAEVQTSFEMGGPDWVSWQTCGTQPVCPACRHPWDPARIPPPRVPLGIRCACCCQ